MNALVKKVSLSKYNKLVVTIVGVLFAVALPQLCHILGLASGTDSLIGRLIQPMYLPVFVAGLVGGPLVGLAVGALSPVISWSISAMPAVALLPAMTLELAAIGVVCGLLKNAKMHTFFKVLLSQIAGHGVYLLTVVLSVYAFNSVAVTVAAVWTTFAYSLLGVVLQWAVVPLILASYNNAVSDDK
jgi:LytS/YehU family sensor histidine kinase